MRLESVFGGFCALFICTIALASAGSDLISCNAFWSPKPEGQKCITSSGAIFLFSSDFSEIGGAVVDTDGLIWARYTSPTTGLPDRLTQSEAKNSCARVGGRLPTKAEMIRADSQRFYEAVNTHYSSAFWTSTISSDTEGTCAFYVEINTHKAYCSTNTASALCVK